MSLSNKRQSMKASENAEFTANKNLLSKVIMI